MEIGNVEDVVKCGSELEAPFTVRVSSPALLTARVRLDRHDTLVEATHLALGGLHQATMDRIRLLDRGIGFTVTGPVEHITIGSAALALPSRLGWLRRERPSYLWLGALTYGLILLIGALSRRMGHGPTATAK